MELSKEQLPRRYDFDDLDQVKLSPEQRCFVETRQADAIHALSSTELDPQNVQKFVQSQAYWTGVKDLCSELLAL